MLTHTKGEGCKKCQVINEIKDDLLYYFERQIGKFGLVDDDIPDILGTMHTCILYNTLGRDGLLDSINDLRTCAIQEMEHQEELDNEKKKDDDLK